MSEKYILLLHTRKVYGAEAYHSGYSLIHIDVNGKKTIQMIEMYEIDGKMAFSGINTIVPAKEYIVNKKEIIFGESFYVGGNLYETTQNRLEYLDVATYKIAEQEDAQDKFNKIKFDAILREKISEIANGRLDYNAFLRNCNGWTKYVADKFDLNIQNLPIYNMGVFWGSLGVFTLEVHKENIISKVYEILERDYPNVDYSTIDFNWHSNSLQIGEPIPYLSLTVSGKTYLIDGSLGNSLVNGQSGTADNNLTILTGGGGDTVNNSGSHVTIDTGSGEYTDSIVNSGSDVEINTGAGRDYINNSGDNTTVNAGAGSDTIINAGDNAVINAGEGADLIQDFGGGNTTIDLGNDNVTDRVVLRKEDGSITQIINAGASDRIVIRQRDLLGIDQLGDDLKLILNGMDVLMKNGANAGPDYIWIKDDRYRRENGTYVLDKQEDGLVAEIVNIGIDMESGSVFGNKMCFKAA